MAVTRQRSNNNNTTGNCRREAWNERSKGRRSEQFSDNVELQELETSSSQCGEVWISSERREKSLASPDPRRESTCVSGREVGKVLGSQHRSVQGDCLSGREKGRRIAAKSVGLPCFRPCLNEGRALQSANTRGKKVRFERGNRPQNPDTRLG